MQDRIKQSREDSYATLFLDLVRLGEMVMKMTTASLVAAVVEDRDRHRYRQLYSLVRANGLGPWDKALNEVLTGPTSQFLLPEVKQERKELTERCVPGSWQYDCLASLAQCLDTLEVERQPLRAEEPVSKWFSMFKQLRNQGVAHASTPTGLYCEACPDLERSINLFVNNFVLFKRPWAYLHRNLSSKYRITPLSEDASPFDYLKSTRIANLPNGVYVHLGQHVRVDLIDSDVDGSDFFLPNGGFNEKRFLMLSYVTGKTAEAAAGPYMTPANQLPPSETEGIRSLDVQSHCFTNLPSPPSNYVRRPILEQTLYGELMNDHHRIVTLVGRGGIDKTALALSVAYQVAEERRFEALLWFSARDIDLMPEGPRPVRQRVFTKTDIAKEFVKLVEPAEASSNRFSSLEYFEQALRESPTGDPYLFVFDNFETVQNPVELATWIDTYIRSPNKALITSRFRQFKADYPVEVPGMEFSEARQLIRRTAEDRGIGRLIDDQYETSLFEESEGHPYVIKVLLGDVAKARQLVPVRRIMRNKEQILDALFERTFASLSFVAQRVFLTLCNWRSTVPQLAVEAVLMRDPDERIDAEGAIEELEQSSFIEREASDKDDQYFISVPLAATEFGKRQLRLHSLKAKVQADTQQLQRFGATQVSGIRRGIRPHIERFFGDVASNPRELEANIPMLEFIASRYPLAWRLLVSLHEESDEYRGREKAKEAVKQYLLSTIDEDEMRWAWNKLADICQKTGDYAGEIHALVELCQLPDVPLDTLNYSAGRLISVLHDQPEMWSEEEQQIIIRQLIEVMEDYTVKLRAKDLGRLAWLCLNLVPKDRDRAKRYTQLGLSRDPNDYHCRRLAEGFSVSR
jgi:hypothetical protein